MPKHVIFSNRAFTSVIAETKEKITTETGGIFLGVMQGDVWYVVEAIDPGPNSIFQPSYFEYDGNYVRHLANKVNRLYGDRLDVLGLWHRHPGSMDTFSRTDDGTITEYCQRNSGITISALVNIDPNFRLTLYVATLNPLSYKKISYDVNDGKIPQEVLNVLYYKEVESQVNSFKTERLGLPQQGSNKSKKVDFCDILTKHLKKMECCAVIDGFAFENNEDDYNDIIDNYLVDECLFCDEIELSYTCNCEKDNKIEFIIGGEGTDLIFAFYNIDFSRKDDYIAQKQFFERIVQFLFPTSEIEKIEGKHPCFIYKGNLYLYKGNLFKMAWEEYKV